MQIFSTRLHGVLDYLGGLLLIVGPWLLGFADGGPAQWVPVAIGVAVIGYSLLTDYELGALRIIPMRVHIAIDILAGIFLAASPWLLGFADVIYWPHLAVGIAEAIGAACTVRTPSDR